jgi:hypothetical protein
VETRRPASESLPSPSLQNRDFASTNTARSAANPDESFLKFLAGWSSRQNPHALDLPAWYGAVGDRKVHGLESSRHCEIIMIPICAYSASTFPVNEEMSIPW